MNYLLLLGQLGLLTMALGTPDIVHQQKKAGQGLPLFIIITFWLWAGCCAMVFGMVLKVGTPNPTPETNVMRFVGGLLWFGTSLRYRLKDAYKLPGVIEQVVNTVLAVLIGVFVLGSLGYGLLHYKDYGFTDTDSSKIAVIDRKLDRNSRIIFSDTARSARLEIKNDSLLKLLGEQRNTNTDLTMQVGVLTGQIGELIGELKSLRRQVVRVNSSVQRQLHSPVVPVSNQPTTQMNFDALDPNRVKAVAPVAGKPGRGSKK